MSRDDAAPSEIREGLNIDESGKAIFEKNEDGSTSIYRETGTSWREYRSGGDDADSGDDDLERTPTLRGPPMRRGPRGD